MIMCFSEMAPMLRPQTSASTRYDVGCYTMEYVIMISTPAKQQPPLASPQDHQRGVAVTSLRRDSKDRVFKDGLEPKVEGSKLSV